MINLHKELDYTSTQKNTLILNKPFIYKEVEVPKQFETNGADVPRIFWSFCPPFEPKFLPAVIVHDYLIKQGDIDFANKMYVELMFFIEVSFRTKMMVKAVLAYWRYRKILNLIQRIKLWH